MATASEKGTLIRIFSTKTGKMLQELRRGSENVVLFSVDFHFQDDWLACISDSGTLHIFNLLKQGEKQLPP
jgi:WD40 repeat protein